MHLTYEQFKNVNLNDVFFDSLKSDYKEFPIWFAKKGGESAYVFRNKHGDIDGFLYLKQENDAITDIVPALPPAKRIKVGTMKINAHGTKLGERFIKKICDHAIFFNVDEVYLTIFEKHTSLINLVSRYGFEQTATKTTKNGQELVFVKPIHVTNDAHILENYPIIKTSTAKCYLLAIYPIWHTRLLPDSILKTESSDIIQDISHTNSIHKVYLAAMRGMDSLKSGDVLLIYRTEDGNGPARFRSVATSICVVEEYKNIASFTNKEQFLNYCRPYSVFTEEELEKFWQTQKYPHVIRFTYNIALKKRVTRGTMIDDLGLLENSYWGFMPLSKNQLLSIAKKGQVNEGLVVD